jgi:hypothetical protein
MVLGNLWTKALILTSLLSSISTVFSHAPHNCPTKFLYFI